MNSRLSAAVVFAASLILPTLSLANDYKVDADHTSVTFRIRHLFSYVEGRFDKFEGNIKFDADNPDRTVIDGFIDVASINTNVEERDTHLRGKDFFHVEEFPKIEFKSSKVTDLGADKKSGKLHGTLKIHGVEKPVVLDVQFLGEGADPWGNKVAGFSATAKLNRKDFGLEWNETLETGGVLVGDEVKIQLDVEGILSE